MVRTYSAPHEHEEGNLLQSFVIWFLLSVRLQEGRYASFVVNDQSQTCSPRWLRKGVVD